VIDHDLRVIFIHVPKTAGVSIYHALGRLDQQGHMTIDEYAEFRSEYFSFAFVRNPWDRLVSCYQYLKGGGRGFVTDIQAQAALDDCDSFEQFAIDIEKYQARLRELPAPELSLPHMPHLLPQVFWTHDEQGGESIDFVGRFERLDHDFALIGDRVGARFELARMNTTEHDEYRSYYSSRSRDAIASAYRDDVDRFGYDF